PRSRWPTHRRTVAPRPPRRHRTPGRTHRSMTPPDRRDVVDYLASLDPAEYQQLVVESRGTPPPTPAATEAQSRAEYMRGTQQRLADAFDQQARGRDHK